jgi:hypothetical protein
MINDFKISAFELKLNHYDFHYKGGVLVMLLIFLALQFNTWNWWQNYLLAAFLNFGFWFIKECVWFMMGIEVEKHNQFFVKLSTYKYFPKYAFFDWKDVRFSIYGGLMPFTIYHYLKICK